MADPLSAERLIDALVPHPIFSDLDPVSLRVLALASERTSLPEGFELFVEGAAADCAYLVLAGSLRLTTQSSEQIARPPELIHPLALIAELRRPATAIAIEDCELIKIPRAVFLRILDDAPALAARLRTRLSRELARSAGELNRLAARRFS